VIFGLQKLPDLAHTGADVERNFKARLIVTQTAIALGASNYTYLTYCGFPDIPQVPILF
jgi:hypothetical protein